jgi:hypothetical protein
MRLLKLVSAKAVLTFCATLFIIIVASLLTNPATESRDLLLSVSNPAEIPARLDLQWDTGYGFNQTQFQTSDVGKLESLKSDSSSFLVIKEFGRLHRLQALRLLSSRPDLQFFLGSSKGISRLNISQTAADHGFLYEARGPQLSTESRDLSGWVFLIIGSSILGLMLMAWAKFLSRKQQILPLAILIFVSFIGLLYAGYPGFLNPFNPLMAIARAETLEYNSYDSVLLGLIWSALYEVYSSFYFVLIIQALIFFSATIGMANKLLSQGWHLKWVSAISIPVLLSPPAVIEMFFPERSIVSGYTNFLFALYVFSVLTQKSKIDLKQVLIIGVIGFMSVSFRTDNIFYALILVASVLWRLPRRMAISYGIGFLSAVFIGTTFLDQAFGMQQTRFSYLALSMVTPMSDIWLMNNTLEQSLSSDDRRAIDDVVKIENLKMAWKYQVFPDRKSYNWNANETQNLAFIEMFGKLAALNFKPFLWVRYSRFLSIAAKSVNYWDSVDPEKPELVALDLREFPDSLSLKSKKGIRGIEGLDRFLYGPLASLYLQLTALVAALLLFRYAPVSALLAMAMATRVVAIMLFAPVPSSFYLFDLYFLGLFLIFSLTYELVRTTRESGLKRQKSLAISLRARWR